MIMNAENTNPPLFETIEWTDAGVVMIDQRRLPLEEIYLTFTTPEEVAQAIRTMVIRGAPAIGVAAAMGLALGAVEAARAGTGAEGFQRRFDALCDLFASTRPTAVNLFWAIERMRRAAHAAAPSSSIALNILVSPASSSSSASLSSGSGAGSGSRGIGALAAELVAEAGRIKEEDIASCRAIGRFGEPLIPDGASILTHCNAGALATGGYGTALGVVRAAKDAGKTIRVLADETRPFLQGARLTAWELLKEGIDTTLITDSMAGFFFQKGEITLAIVGADRIAANGDVANKIGTYQAAVLAKENGVPFYVAAPLTTIDLTVPDGDHIPIEERAADEVTSHGGTRIAPLGVGVRNPAFDITPHRYVTAIITDRGVARAPYTVSLAALAKG